MTEQLNLAGSHMISKALTQLGRRAISVSSHKSTSQTSLKSTHVGSSLLVGGSGHKSPWIIKRSIFWHKENNHLPMPAKLKVTRLLTAVQTSINAFGERALGYTCCHT